MGDFTMNRQTPQTVNVEVGGLMVWMLTFLFLTLKLCGVITWSWWWVFSPLLITAGAVLGLVIGVFIFFMITALVLHSKIMKDEKLAEGVTKHSKSGAVLLKPVKKTKKVKKV